MLHGSVTADAFKARTRVYGRALRLQWQPVILPTLVLWTVGTVISCTLLHPFDVVEYQGYAHAALRAPLLQRLPAEYPSPALVVFWLPLLLPLSYPWAFAVISGVVLLFLVTSYDGVNVPGMDREAARRLVVYLTVGACFLVTARYDIFAAAAAFWALRAALRDRWSAAWTWSAVGCVLKIFPAVFWPAFLIAEWRRHGRFPLRRLAWVGASAVVLAALPALFDHADLLNTLHFYARRPDEMEGLPAGLSLLVEWSRTTVVHSFHSVNVVNAVARPMGTIVGAVAVVGCVGTWWVQARGRIPMEAACLLSLTLAVLGSKVGSAQYLIWLMPLWAMYPVNPQWLMAGVANLMAFPYGASGAEGLLSTRSFIDSLMLVLLARNLLIAWGTWTWFRSLRPQRRAVPATPSVVGGIRG